MKLSIFDLQLSIASWFFFLLLGLGGCTEYQPPFTHQLTPDMDFKTVKSIAAKKGYNTFNQIADYQGYCLLSFEKSDGGDDVFLVLDTEKRPALRTLGFEKIDSDKLVHFVDDLFLHQQGG